MSNAGKPFPRWIVYALGICAFIAAQYWNSERKRKHWEQHRFDYLKAESDERIRAWQMEQDQKQLRAKQGTSAAQK